MIELILEETTRTVLAAIHYPFHSIVERRVPIPDDIVAKIVALPDDKRLGPLMYWFEQYTRVFSGE